MVLPVAHSQVLEPPRENRNASTEFVRRQERKDNSWSAQESALNNSQAIDLQRDFG